MCRAGARVQAAGANVDLPFVRPFNLRALLLAQGRWLRHLWEVQAMTEVGDALVVRDAGPAEIRGPRRDVPAAVCTSHACRALWPLPEGWLPMSSDLQRKARLRQHQQTCADGPTKVVGSALVCVRCGTVLRVLGATDIAKATGASP